MEVDALGKQVGARIQREEERGSSRDIALEGHEDGLLTLQRRCSVLEEDVVGALRISGAAVWLFSIGRRPRISFFTVTVSGCIHETLSEAYAGSSTARYEIEEAVRALIERGP